MIKTILALSLKMIIVVTGKIGIGKTTVCLRLIQIAKEKGYACGGIVTCKAEDEGIVIEDIRTGSHETLASTKAVYKGPRTPKYFFNPAGIEFGIRAIGEGVNSDILFVDEIGPLELRGEGFFGVIELIRTAKVKRLVLVIRKELVPCFLPDLGPGPRIFEVTPANRDGLPQEIWSSLSTSVLSG